MPQQTLENHPRMVAGYHYLTFGLLTLNLLYALVQLVRFFSLATIMGVVLAVAIVLIAWYTRVFALAVQDRVIRLEERLRIERLCPDLAARASTLHVRQLVALRFASDDEFPSLLRRVLDEDIRSGKVIKQQIRNWRADEQRA